jgi:hypothetical protein
MTLDRGALYSLGVGWNHEFAEVVSDYVDLAEIDLLDDSEVRRHGRNWWMD